MRRGLKIKALICAFLALSMASCSRQPVSDLNQNQSSDEMDEIIETVEITEETDEMETQKSGEKRINMEVDGQSISVVLYDNDAANALYDMLPLELSFEDYNSTEKISYLPEDLPTTNGASWDPDVGDFCLYAPWGNLCIFYRDFRESSGLVSLGYIEDGIEILSGMDDDFSAVLTAAD